MSQVVYARVPDAIKEGLDAYAADRGLTTTSAIVDLVGRGLEASQNEASIARLEEKLRDTEMRLLKQRHESDQANSKARELEERERAFATAYRTLADRLEQRIGSCSGCSADVTGRDILVSMQCPSCQAGLTPLLGGRVASARVNDRDLLPLLGAVGLVLGGVLVFQAGKG